MKNFFSVIVIFGVLLLGGGYVYVQQQNEKTRQTVTEDLANARRTFAQKARAAATQDDNDTYLRSMRSALESYKEELTKKVYKDNEDLRDPEAKKKELDEQFKKNQIDEAKHKSLLEGYTIVREAFDTLMSGAWTPVLTAEGSADTRLDLYTLTTVTDADGKPWLEGKFFFWGIEDSTDVRWGQLNMRMWTSEMQLVKKVETQVEKVLGKAEGEAQPHIIIQKPHNYVAEFPSYVSVGYLRLPLLPREAKAVDIEYTYSTRVAGGGETQSVLKWEKLPIPESWKLKEGQVWDADEIEATEDEIAGRDSAEQKPEGETEEKQQ